MNIAVTLTLAASGLFLLVGLIGGVLKYHGMMTRPNHRAHPYIDTAHRAALMYSFTALVMAELLRYSPYPVSVQVLISAVPLFFFATAIGQYFWLGLRETTSNQFRERNFTTTVGMVLLIVGEVGGIAAIVWGFFQTQVLG